MNLPSDHWDQSRDLYGVGGDDEFLSELAGIFSAACPTLLKSLEDSIAAKNCFSIADTAHLLGRAAQNLAASRFTEAALVVEKMARRNDLDDIGNAYYALRQEAGRLLDALGDFRRGRFGLTGSP
jgi:HPt (histidine-containing phosphotransfer) domain-containing protein